MIIKCAHYEFMILRYFRYIKNYVMSSPKRNIIAIVGTTGVGKSQVCTIGFHTSGTSSNKVV